MQRVGLIFCFALVAAAPLTAEAIPRFAARNGMECIQCHVNPTGGGIRNDYGRNVFEQAWLPWATSGQVDDWMGLPKSEAEGDADPQGVEAASTLPLDFAAFGADLGEWLTLGADLRAAYIFIQPDRPLTAGDPIDVTNSFFLMQADLYHAARLNEYLTLVLDVGIYSGFEAWGLFHFPLFEGLDFYVKVGRFMPPFGIREVEHQLYTREVIGLGATGRDTGVEVTTYAGPFTLSMAVLNGTFADSAFDAAGADHRGFEKAFAARLTGAATLGALRAQLGFSFYYNDNINQPNPLFSSALPPTTAPQTGRGVNETRLGGFVTANLGRFTYLGELVLVHDQFASESLSHIRGYVGYQELSFVATQGLELVVTGEFMDPDMELLGNVSGRFGMVVELFPLSFTEIRAMVRREWSDTSPTGGSWDLVVFAHLFM